jgi:opacity protein-like surface antigen
MTTRFWRGMLGAAAAIAVLAPAAAQAQIMRVSGSDTRQSFGVNIGAFMPKGEDSRVDGDALFVNRDALLFEIDDFKGVSFGAEWLVGVSKYIEAGVDVSFYQRTVPSIYREFIDTDDTEIEQDLKLRIIPVTASVRFLPVGRDASVQPYIGIGASLLNWRYSETGEFIDFSEGGVVFRDRIVAKGNTLAPMFIGGVRFPVADIWTIGGEFRYQAGDGDTGGAAARFATGADKIDLGGWTANVNFHFRF